MIIVTLTSQHSGKPAFLSLETGFSKEAFGHQRLHHHLLGCQPQGPSRGLPVPGCPGPRPDSRRDSPEALTYSQLPDDQAATPPPFSGSRPSGKVTFLRRSLGAISRAWTPGQAADSWRPAHLPFVQPTPATPLGGEGGTDQGPTGEEVLTQGQVWASQLLWMEIWAGDRHGALGQASPGGSTEGRFPRAPTLLKREAVSRDGTCPLGHQLKRLLPNTCTCPPPSYFPPRDGGGVLCHGSGVPHQPRPVPVAQGDCGGDRCGWQLSLLVGPRSPGPSRQLLKAPSQDHLPLGVRLPDAHHEPLGLASL